MINIFERRKIMALDGLVIHSIADELNSLLNGAKIDKIYQPEEDEILLQIRNNKVNYRLVLSASASNPRNTSNPTVKASKKLYHLSLSILRNGSHNNPRSTGMTPT